MPTTNSQATKPTCIPAGIYEAPRFKRDSDSNDVVAVQQRKWRVLDDFEPVDGEVMRRVELIDARDGKVIESKLVTSDYVDRVCVVKRDKKLTHAEALALAHDQREAKANDDDIL